MGDEPVEAVMKQRSNCVTLEQAIDAHHVAAMKHTETVVCLRRTCEICQRLGEAIVALGDACEARGCRTERCVYDPSEE